jgi:uncharacterized protein (DUF58 family)
MKPAPPSEPLVSLPEIAELELFILKRMREFTLGSHASAFKGTGFNFVGVRDWEPGDRLSSIDWPQSSLNSFSPIITREFEQNSTATIVAVADASLSTRCGAQDTSIAVAVARTIATFGLSAVLFQDLFGLITFDERGRQTAAARPGIGKAHVSYCLDLYQTPASAGAARERPVTATIAGHLRKTSLVPVISDFLFADAPQFIKELALLNATHDVFLTMVDGRFAYRLPAPASAGWIDVFDVETGRTRVVSRREFEHLDARVQEWQDEIDRLARDAGLDIVHVGLDRWAMETALVEFVAERRLRKLA